VTTSSARTAPAGRLHLDQQREYRRRCRRARRARSPSHHAVHPMITSVAPEPRAVSPNAGPDRQLRTEMPPAGSPQVGQEGPAPGYVIPYEGRTALAALPSFADGRCVLSRRPPRRRRRRPSCRQCRLCPQMEQSGWRGLRQGRPWTDYGIAHRFEWGSPGRELRGRRSVEATDPGSGHMRLKRS
jgi:hypothetical protein